MTSRRDVVERATCRRDVSSQLVEVALQLGATILKPRDHLNTHRHIINLHSRRDIESYWPHSRVLRIATPVN